MTIPTLRTSRLTLRPITDEDLPHLIAGLNDWSVARNISAIQFPYSQTDALAYFPEQQKRMLDDRSYFWVINDPEFCGIVAVDFEGSLGELGYWLIAQRWGEGYASEAARAAVGFAFARSTCKKLVAGHAADNRASGRVLAKLGFVEIERGERYYVSRKMMVARIGLELTRERWQALQ